MKVKELIDVLDFGTTIYLYYYDNCLKEDVAKCCFVKIDTISDTILNKLVLNISVNSTFDALDISIE